MRLFRGALLGVFLVASTAASAQYGPGGTPLGPSGGGGGGSPTGTAGGDLSGTYPNPGVAKIVGVAPGTGVATALGVNIGSAGAVITFNGALGTPSSGVATNLTGLPISTGLTGAGTGALTALGVNVGSAGAFVVNGGPLGTPSSGVLTSATGLPISTGLTGAGTGVLTALGINVGSAGAPVLFNGAGGTPSSLTLTNGTGLPAAGVTGLAASATTDTTNASNITSGTVPAAVMGNSAFVRFKLLGANLNTTADQPITLTLPTGSTRFKMGQATVGLVISNPSISMTTAVCGLWTGASKSGVTIVGSGAAGVAMSGLTSTSENTNGNTIGPAVNNQGTTSFNLTGNSPANTLYFACSTIQGATATADVTGALEVLN